MASIVSKLIGVYQECLLLRLDVKLSLEIRDGKEYFSSSRTHKPLPTLTAGPLQAAAARKPSSPRDTRRREEWWERRRRGLESQASPKLRSYSEAVKNNRSTTKPQETLCSSKERNCLNSATSQSTEKMKGTERYH